MGEGVQLSFKSTCLEAIILLPWNY